MKRFLVILLSGVILASSVPMSSYAAVGSVTKVGEPPVTSSAFIDASLGAVIDIAPVAIKGDYPVSTAVDPTNKALESAIIAVKEKITIPKEYSEFNYYFYNTSSYADSYWNLSWRNPATEAQIQVNCDQKNHITNFSMYDNTSNTSSIPAYLKKELKSTADAFIRKIEPEVASKLEFVEATYDGIYSGNYNYNYRRIVNGVVLPDNTVTIGVNSVTGEVRTATINWLYDTTIPSSTVKLTKEEATKLIKENMNMNLVYRTDYYRIYDGITNNSVQKAYLVYEPTQAYISIDANTGEVYLTRNEWVETPNAAGSKADGAGSAFDSENKSADQVLTEEEITKIEELKNLISKEEAIKAVTGNKYLYLDKNLKAYTATLNKSNDGEDDSYTWNVSLSDPREVNYEKEGDYYRAYASANVDAKTGKILSYYASIKSQYDEKNGTWNTVKIPFNKEQGRVILEKFLKSQISSRFNNSKLVNQNDEYIAYYKNDIPVYGGYLYQYNRVNDGVEFPYNGINGSVDGVTGKIYSYNCNWNDHVVFEAKTDIMTADQAMDQYLSKDGYGLKYEINIINSYDPNYKNQETMIDYTKAYSVNYEVRLVYRPDINPSFISPFTGEQLDQSGKVYKEAKSYSYLDIPDTKENRAIMLLSDMNIGFEGDNFYPDAEITKGEFNDLLQKVGYGYYEEDNNNTDRSITNEETAYSFVTKLGLEKVAGLKDIYRTGYEDEAGINPNYLGAVALAKALGIMEGDSNNYFYPHDKVTRLEAVNLILNFIGVQQSGVMW